MEESTYQDYHLGTHRARLSFRRVDERILGARSSDQELPAASVMRQTLRCTWYASESRSGSAHVASISCCSPSNCSPITIVFPETSTVEADAMLQWKTRPSKTSGPRCRAHILPVPRKRKCNMHITAECRCSLALVGQNTRRALSCRAVCSWLNLGVA